MKNSEWSVAGKEKRKIKMVKGGKFLSFIA